MGQGNIKYRKVKRTPQTGENAGKELWYATVVTRSEERRVGKECR